jgi:hypothetical protein
MSRVLTAEAQADRFHFHQEYGYDGNCYCFTGAAPCGSCTHPGNPHNQDDDESCWEPAPWASRNLREGRVVGRWRGQAQRDHYWNIKGSNYTAQVCSRRAAGRYATKHYLIKVIHAPHT